MFRRLTNRITQAINGGADPDHVQLLTSMGFSTEAANQALQATSGNVDQAAELLLAQGAPVAANNSSTNSSSSSSSSTTATTAARRSQATARPGTGNEDDAVMQQILQESLQMEENRRLQEVMASSATTTKPQARTAAMNKAAQAAEQRAAASAQWGKKRSNSTASSTKSTGLARKPASSPSSAPVPSTTTPLVQPARTKSGGLSKHHPDVKVIPKLQDKSKEEQILRCADRLKGHPQALDTLYRALTAVQGDPENVKFRRIDKTTPGYQRSLAPAPGAEDLLRAMNYRVENPQTLLLDRFMVDPALLYLGVSALEQTRLTPEYKDAKRKAVFAKSVAAIFGENKDKDDTTESQQQQQQRAEHARQVPPEPTEGRGALLQVHMAEQTLRRRFDGDDTLDNVLHWLAATGGNVIYDNLVQTREWCLVDRNRYPLQPLDCVSLKHQTLQYIGCWPSGKLEIMPSSDAWKEQLHDKETKLGSSRGLGSAPSEVL